MEEITRRMNKYRECIRHIWNAFILPLETSRCKWCVQHDFEEVGQKLFSLMILDPLGMAHPDKAVEYPDLWPFLRVTPRLPATEILVNRTHDRSGYWDDPVNRINPDEAEFRFVDFFDFGVLGFRDFQYYEVRIVAFPKHPHLIGRNALVRAKDARVYFDNAAE